jgi:hypothetical protein
MLTGRLMFAILSDHLNRWSDGFDKSTCGRTAQTTQRSRASAAGASIHLARFPYRAIQAVRQARLQVRQRSRTWSQVLPVSHLSRSAATSRLRAAGQGRSGRGVFGQLSSGARNPGGDLRDQPRVAAPPRGALTRCHGHVANSHRCRVRYETGRGACCQYAVGLAGRAGGGCAPSRGRR